MSSMAERLQHQGVVLDMEVQDDRETALMLLEDLRLYPDIEATPDYERHIIPEPRQSRRAINRNPLAAEREDFLNETVSLWS
ncbi:hypothetical protein Aduo_006448 [Ancylostoma duodenale]